MKIILVTFLVFHISIVVGQQNHFNHNLNNFCSEVLNQTAGISEERKLLLNVLAKEMVDKRYILFTCKTNSRRTLLLQTWAQTAFLYVGLFNKFAFSSGDTITEIYPKIANVLINSGFYCRYAEDGNKKGYIISINDELPMNIILPKNYFGTVDTSHIVITNICGEGEQSNIANENSNHFKLPYQSPTIYDKTEMEKIKYTELNKTIAIEMMYLALKTKENIANAVNLKKQ